MSYAGKQGFAEDYVIVSNLGKEREMSFTMDTEEGLKGRQKWRAFNLGHSKLTSRLESNP